MSGFIVEISKNCWLASWAGDPGRTCVMSSAKVYKTDRGAKIALGIARRYRPCKNAKIVKLPGGEG